MTPDEEAEAIQIELELRNRSSGSSASETPKEPQKLDGKRGPLTDEQMREWNESGFLGRIGFLFKYGSPGKHAKEVMSAPLSIDRPINIALEAGGPVAGQAAGVATGPFAPVMVPLLGALGGMGGDALAQLHGEEKFSTGRMLAAGVTGAIPGANLAKSGAREVLREGGKYAAGNLIGKTVETEIDRGEMPSLTEGVASAGLGVVGAGLSKAMAKTLSSSADDLLFSSRNKVFESLRKEGAVVPPHELGQGSDILSSVGGKAALQQQAAKRNQFVWQKLAREEIGLSKEALPISIADLEAVRADYAKPYQELDVISNEAKQHIKDRLRKIAMESDPHEAMVKLEEPATKESLSILGKLASADVNALKEARDNAQRAYDSFKAGNPTAYDEWVNQKGIADKLEQQIEDAAASLKDPTLSARLKEARKKIAQTYSIQDSINRATGLVDPVYLGRQLDRGDPLTGNLKKIAEFQLAFNREAVEAGKVPAPGVGNLGTMNAVQQASRGNAPGVIGAVVGSTIGAPARMALLSDFTQDRLLSREEKQNFSAALARYIAEYHPHSRRNNERERQAATQIDNSPD